MRWRWRLRWQGRCWHVTQILQYYIPVASVQQLSKSPPPPLSAAAPPARCEGTPTPHMLCEDNALDTSALTSYLCHRTSSAGGELSLDKTAVRYTTAARRAHSTEESDRRAPSVGEHNSTRVDEGRKRAEIFSRKCKARTVYFVI